MFKALLNRLKSLTETPYESLSPEDFASAINTAGKSATLLDVRSPAEAKEGKIPGAKVINLMGSDFQAQISKLPKDKAYFVYCRSGARSARACGIMSGAGFSQVTNLQGGIMNWMRAGKKVK